MAQEKDVNAGPRSRQIRSDIDRTRAGIDRTLSELENRLTTKEIAYDVWGAVRHGSTVGAGRAWRAAQDYPLPATLIAVGVGWMLYESSRSGKQEIVADDLWADQDLEPGVTTRVRHAVSDTAGRVGQRASQAADTVRDTASRASEAVTRAATDAAESVRETAASARERAGDLAERTRLQAASLGEAAKERAAQIGERARVTTRRLGTNAQRTFDERPLVVGAAGLALGLLAGLLAPRSIREDELMGESRDRLLDSARERSREVLDKGRRVAEVAVDAAKSAAERQQLDPAHLVEKAREVGTEVKAAAEEEVRR